MRLAVVSPFLDCRHGTERCVVEQIEHFLRYGDCEIHVYAQSVEDLEVIPYPKWRTSDGFPKKPIWHRVPKMPGPHLLNFLWWYIANQALRWFDRVFGSLCFDVVFSPGINCADADAILAHVVFHELYRLVRDELRLRDAPLRSWPVLLHRILYYKLVMTLENRLYRDPQIGLAAVSGLSARQMESHFGRKDVRAIFYGVDHLRFNSSERIRRRSAARQKLKFSDSDFVVLLIGNGWKNKGLGCLLRAVAANSQLPFRILLVGKDDRRPFLAQIRELGLTERVRFAEPSADVMEFYAAADVYAGPSLQDSFALPPLEAMACGLPVIASALAGVAQIITGGRDGFVLQNPQDSATLAQLLRRVHEDAELRRFVGENAARAAQSLTWERNASETWEFLRAARSARGSSAATQR